MHNEWAVLAATASDEDLRERILTGFKSGKPFTPYLPTLRLPESIGSVLDFGCGLGRNFPYLTTVAARVVGFDLPEMIARVRDLAPGAVVLSSDWDAVRAMPFDLIFGSLVLQHVPEDWCRRVLADFARMAPATYLLARGRGTSGSTRWISPRALATSIPASAASSSTIRRRINSACSGRCPSTRRGRRSAPLRSAAALLCLREMTFMRPPA
jgi:hypothetical protein